MNGTPELAGPAAERPTWVRWRIVALLMAFSFVSWFLRVSMPIAGDDRIMEEYGVTESQMGDVYSIFLFTYMVCMTPGGWFIDRFGPKAALAVMGLGLAVCAALTGAVGFVATTAAGLWLALLAVRAVMGVFATPVYPGSSHTVARWVPFRQRGGANGLVQGMAALGIACTYPVFGFLIDRLDWQWAFVATGAATAALALVWLWYAADDPGRHRGVNEAERRRIEEGRLAWPLTDDLSARRFGEEPPETDLRAAPPAKGEEAVAAGLPTTGPKGEGPGPGDARARPVVLPAGGWWALLRNRSLVLLTVSYAAVGYFEYLFFFWIHYYFKDVLKLDREASRYYSMLPTLAMTAGMLLGGLLSDRLMRRIGYRLGRALVPAGAMLAAAGLLALGLLAEAPAFTVAWFTLALGVLGAVEGPMWATAVELGGRRGGTAAGIFNTGGNLGGVVAPALTPRVSAWLGWQWGIGLGSVVCLAGVALWLWINPQERVGEKG